MKQQNKHSKFWISICSGIILCCLMLSSCSTAKINNVTRVAMVKNAEMSTYGTGFAVGIPGKPTDTIVTSYSIVATRNGAAPKTAEVSINGLEKKLYANVIFYDIGRNVAVLKLSRSTDSLRPMILDGNVSYDDKIYTEGYDGTGNIMSDFERFTTTDIVRYSGNISTYDELNSVVMYKYSNEFNRALVGGPATDEKGNVIGMCAYSLNNMNTYSQYILSAEELAKIFIMQNVEFMTADELRYKHITIFSLLIGLLVFAFIVIYTCLVCKNGVFGFKKRYLIIKSGTLAGSVYDFDGKLTIGRDISCCDVVYPIDEPGISAMHCSIIRENKKIYLVDHFSKYGTFLEDGTRVESSQPYLIKSNRFAFYPAKSENRIEFMLGKEIKK